MQFISRTIFTALIAFASIAVHAQEQRTLKNNDGSKYFDGNIWIKNRNATGSPSSYLSGDGIRERDLSDNWKNSFAPFLPENIFSQVVLDGQCTLYYKNGNVYVAQGYEHGVANGKYEERYMDGDRMISGKYKSGMMDGEWKYYFKNGKIAFEGSFYAISQKELFEALSLKTVNRSYGKENSFSDERYPFAHNVIAAFKTYDRYLVKLGTGLQGRYNFYYYDGQKSVSLNYKDGVPEGIWQTWDRNGKLSYKAEFVKGKVDVILQDGEEISYEQYKEKSKVPDMRSYEGDPNGIDPGIGLTGVVEAPPAPAIFRYVEQMPEAPFNVQTWISDKLRYPAEAKKNAVQGRVIVEFVVRKDGSINDIKVFRGIGSGCDEAAIEVFKKMPKWKPGKQNGQSVDVYYTMPVTFKL